MNLNSNPSNIVWIFSSGTKGVLKVKFLYAQKQIPVELRLKQSHKRPWKTKNRFLLIWTQNEEDISIKLTAETMNIDRFYYIKFLYIKKLKEKIKRQKDLGIHLWYVLQIIDLYNQLIIQYNYTDNWYLKWSYRAIRKK